MIEITAQEDPIEGTITIMATFSVHELMRNHLPNAIISEAASLIAKRFADEHYQDVVAQIEQKAVANLVVAESAAAINKTLKESIPSRVLEVHKTKRELYQSGVFAGLKRIG